jgi:glycosyltransferase involved in cell wall biosynthesis
LDEHLQWLGWVRFEELPGIYGENDVLVLPSRFEGMPSVMLQAMACGCAILCTDVFGVDELVDNGKNGFLVHEDDRATLADKILSLRSSDLEAMQNHSRGKASLFRCETVAKRLEYLYLKACAN